MTIVLRALAGSFPITVIVNHLRSLIGIDDPSDGPRVRAKRRAQAEFLANLVQQRQLADPAERIVVVGDFNAFGFGDGYVDVVGTVRGAPTPAANSPRRGGRARASRGTTASACRSRLRRG